MENLTARLAENLIHAALAELSSATVEVHGVDTEGRPAESYRADRLAVKIAVPLTQSTAVAIAAVLTRAGVEDIRVTETDQSVMFTDGTFRQRKMRQLTGLIPDDAQLAELAFELPAAEIRLAERWRRDARTADAIAAGKPLCTCEHCGDQFVVKGSASKGRFCCIECCYAARRGWPMKKKAAVSG